MKRILDTRSMILCALFAALTAAGALIAVPLPFSPVPISLQVLFVFLSGAMLGKYLGALSQIIYLLLVIYMTGTPWLMYIARMNLAKAVIAGILPFLPGDILKAFIAAYVLNNKNIHELYNLTI